MSAFNLKVNGRNHSIEADPRTPLLYVVSDDLGLRGTPSGISVNQRKCLYNSVGGIMPRMRFVVCDHQINQMEDYR